MKVLWLKANGNELTKKIAHLNHLIRSIVANVSLQRYVFGLLVLAEL